MNNLDWLVKEINKRMENVYIREEIVVSYNDSSDTEWESIIEPDGTVLSRHKGDSIGCFWTEWEECFPC